jgi:hypothetical protein
MSDSRFIFRKLTFAGPAKSTRELDFVDGVNVIYGASNSGKSYTIKALDFMCGAGSALPEIAELRGYETCWLEQDLPITGRVRLSRAVRGGDFEASFIRRLDRVRDTQPAKILSALHSNPNSLSRFLLGELGIIDNKQIASTQNGKKASFSFRHFAAYMFTEETPMMAEWSPIKIAPQSNDTFDKNVMKFILTGDDDSGIIETPKPNEQRIANAGKIEIVEEWIQEAVADLHRSFSEDEVVDKMQVAAQEAALSKTLEEHHATLAKYQTELDRLRRQRRRCLELREEFEERAGEIALTLERFGLLASVYKSDVERLEALEEGAAALMTGAGRPCPLCGAEPEHQREVHGLDHVERSRRAVAAEISKIRVERADLGKAAASLKAEGEGLAARITRLSGEIAELEGAIEKLLPLEVSSRESYEALDLARQRLRNALNLLDRIESLGNRKKELEAFKAKGARRGSVAVGVAGEIGFELAQIAQSTLRAWRFPGNPIVSFDDKTHDILIDGKNRRGNGKGVRALMNSAFKISVLVYCHLRDLPHPGIVALDSPLLSYRDPINSKHGALSSDEELVVKSGLSEYFYRYLLELSDRTQFVIVENDPPPFDLGPKSMVTLFVGSTGEGGRPGLL